MAKSEENVPAELVETFEEFKSSLDGVETVMKRLVEIPRHKLLQDLSPMEVAKLDLISAYAVNSLFWMYLITQGVNPRKHEIKGELDRIKGYMAKVREIEDREKAPKLQKQAAKRFVRNAMFDLEEKNKEKLESKGECEAEQDDDGNQKTNNSEDLKKVDDSETQGSSQKQTPGSKKKKDRRKRDRKRSTNNNDKPSKKKKR